MTLSEKRIYVNGSSDLYDEYDVKQFIKDLKKDLSQIRGKTASGKNRLPGIILAEVDEIIDKSAGEKLL